MEIKNAKLTFVKAISNRDETNTIIIHHIGEINRDVTPQEVHQWHLNNGWAGCGYHFLISKDGTVWECRPRDTIGSHAYGANTDSIGINVVGDFEAFEPEDAQIASLVELLVKLCSDYEITPDMTTIIGHRDAGQTSCPGQRMYDRIPEVVKKVREAFEACDARG